MRYLIDGHNLIGKLPDLSLRDPDDEHKLIRRLHVFAQRIRGRLTVVFDPGTGYVPPQPQTYRDVRVIYAPQGNTADQVILGHVRSARRPRDIVVVTSDLALSARARGLGARVMRAEDFAQEMQPPPEERDQMESEERAEVHVSKEEVDAWLREFREARKRRQDDGSPD